MTQEPFDLRGEEESEAQEKARLLQAQVDDRIEIKWLMSSEQGRQYVWRLLERAGIFESSFQPDSMTMSYREGLKVEGLRTLQLVNTHCPDAYLTMVKEENARRKPNDGERTDDAKR